MYYNSTADALELPVKECKRNQYNKIVILNQMAVIMCCGICKKRKYFYFNLFKITGATITHIDELVQKDETSFLKHWDHFY